MKIVKNVQPPTGLSRLLFRIPIYVYRLGVGWLFGDRVMLLNHIGRISGKHRQTVSCPVSWDLPSTAPRPTSGRSENECPSYDSSTEAPRLTKLKQPINSLGEGFSMFTEVFLGNPSQQFAAGVGAA